MMCTAAVRRSRALRAGWHCSSGASATGKPRSWHAGILELATHARELGSLELITFDEIEPVSSSPRNARCRSRAILKSGERYPRETKSRHAVKRDG